MRVPSRRMPPAKRRGTPFQRVIVWLIVAVFAVSYLYSLSKHPIIVVAMTVAAISVVWWNRRKTTRHLTELARLRTGESISEFARAFDARQVDTWAIRAVYEQVQQQLRFVYPGFPVRATDRLKEDLWMDPDDIDMDLTADVTSRTGRSMRDFERNPMHGKVTTVADLVAFFAAQPKA